MVSFKFSDEQVPSVSNEELLLPHYTCCGLSGLCCNRHSLFINSYLSRIERIENPSCSTCGLDLRHFLSYFALSCYRLFAVIAFW